MDIYYRPQDGRFCAITDSNIYILSGDGTIFWSQSLVDVKDFGAYLGRELPLLIGGHLKDFLSDKVWANV